MATPPRIPKIDSDLDVAHRTNRPLRDPFAAVDPATPKVVASLDPASPKFDSVLDPATPKFDKSDPKFDKSDPKLDSASDPASPKFDSVLDPATPKLDISDRLGDADSDSYLEVTWTVVEDQTALEPMVSQVEEIPVFEQAPLDGGPEFDDSADDWIIIES